MTIANRHSISVARCGLLFASSDKLTEKDFLPFPDQLEDKKDKKGKSRKSRVTKETAVIFMDAVRTGELSPIVMTAFKDYIDEITTLVE